MPGFPNDVIALQVVIKQWFARQSLQEDTTHSSLEPFCHGDVLAIS